MGGSLGSRFAKPRIELEYYSSQRENSDDSASVWCATRASMSFQLLTAKHSPHGSLFLRYYDPIAPTQPISSASAGAFSPSIHSATYSAAQGIITQPSSHAATVKNGSIVAITLYELSEWVRSADAAWNEIFTILLILHVTTCAGMNYSDRV